VIVSRTGEKRGTFFCLPTPPPFDPEYQEFQPLDRPAWSPDGQLVAVNGVAVCRIDGSTGYWLSPGFDPDWQTRTR
jgi:hypothetical protein